MSTQFTFEINGLYILLSDSGDKSYTFHWGLYLHQSTTSGYLYHLINEPNSTSWRFDPRPSQNVINPNRLFNPIPRKHHLSSVWVKEALFELDDEGYIKLTQSVNEIEVEARNLAIRNKSQGKKTISRSAGSQA
ncbi:uncharacterized protein N7482_008445 [Penicillium canariense]|uniref:Uncharacterized protein n=1 Tax=Penicillium canariense TaxID=189055 RepID=A0A9W9LJ05_9EURO|nr:uncharacterized protein N7482_008445 [Penicillium canariense]KAJ5157345.1 hypothetical protein N7482_008445 [Penicillium canariense]